MKNPLVLTFDIGTQSLRALLIDSKGNTIGKSKQEYAKPYYSTQPGWAEQSPEMYWDKLCIASNDLKNNFPNEWEDIICVTVATIRDTFTCLDKDGKPLRDFIVWLDQRVADCKEPLPFKSRAAFKLVGMTEALAVQRKITKSNWIAENEPEIWAKTYKYAPISTLVNFRLTGQMRDSVASMIGHVPLDYKNKKWKDSLDIQFPVFNIPKDKLVDLVNPLENIGYITEQASKQTGIKAGLPLIATGSDKGCETLGSGVIDKNSASLSFGTAATIQFSTDKYVEPSPFLPSYPAIIPTLYNPEVQIFRGYWMVSWFMKEFAEKEVVKAKELRCSPEDLLNEYLKLVPPGCQGLMLQPYWAPQLKQPEGRGSIIGFNADHTRIHIYRAIIEGIGFALYDAMLTLQKRSGYKIQSLSVAGGGSQSDVICQITADMFGLPVKRSQTYETTGLGGGIAGFIAMGVYKDFSEAIENMVHFRPAIQPDMKTHAIYEKLYHEVYKTTYSHLRPLYLKLYDILKMKK